MKRRHPRKIAFVVFALVALMGIFLDRLTKSLAVLHLSDGHVEPFIPGVMDFRLIYNTGAAWGLFDGARVFFLVMMVFALVAMVAYLLYFKRHTAVQVIGLGLIAAGAIGNGIDRATTGEVVDFLHTLFISFPSFNIADSCITVGVILFIFVLFFGEPEPWGKREVVAVEEGNAPVGEPSDSEAPEGSDVENSEEPRLHPETDDARV